MAHPSRQLPYRRQLFRPDQLLLGLFQFIVRRFQLFIADAQFLLDSPQFLISRLSSPSLEARSSSSLAWSFSLAVELTRIAADTLKSLLQPAGSIPAQEGDQVKENYMSNDSQIGKHLISRFSYG